MNTIDQAIKSRLGGEIYKQLRSYYKLRKFSDWPFPDDALKNALAQYFMLAPKVYFLTSYAVKKERIKSIYDIYQRLCDLYTSSQSGLLFDFNGAILPKPLTKEAKLTFAEELIDFFLYYLIKDIHFCDIVVDEGPYEIKNIQIEDGDIVIDCGANMGIFSAVASRKGAIVYAFEPSAYIIETYLSKTEKWNPNINICQFALSDKEEEMSFIQDYVNIGAGKLSSVPRNEQSKENTVTVQAIPLDTYVERNNIPRVDFIKADIEGAERYMLMGAKRVLKEFAPKISICTYHLPDDPRVLRKLILDANPNYIIEERFRKMYAYVR